MHSKKVDVRKKLVLSKGYLCKPLSYNVRKSFSNLMCSTAPLHIETGRSEQPRLEAHERYCQVCNSENVEDEKHFLLLCLAFTDERQKLFHTVSTVYNGFNDVSNDEKFIFLMSEPSVYRFTSQNLPHNVAKKGDRFYLLTNSVCTSGSLKFIMYNYIIYH